MCINLAIGSCCTNSITWGKDQQFWFDIYDSNRSVEILKHSVNDYMGDHSLSLTKSKRLVPGIAKIDEANGVWTIWYVNILCSIAPNENSKLSCKNWINDG